MVATLTTQSAGAQTASVEFGNSTYELGSPGLTWEEATAEAAARGGKLLEVDSAAENAFIMEQFWVGAPIWLGWNDVNQEGELVGLNGRLAPFTNWLPNTGSSRRQDFARIASATGQWDDGTNTSQGVFDGNSWNSTGTTVTVIEFEPFFFFEDSAYQIGLVGTDWDNAATLADEAGAKLLTVESQAENDFIIDHFWNHVQPGRIMLGITDREQEGVWRNQDGEIVHVHDEPLGTYGYTNWFRGRADNVSGNGVNQQADWGSIQDENGFWDTTWLAGGLYYNGSSYVGGRTFYVFEYDASSANESIVQSGTVTAGQRNGGQWHSVNFDISMNDPIVVMGPVSFNGAHEAFARVRNVTTTGFEFQIDEWKYRDGGHGDETVSWVAVERGVHTLDDGRIIEADVLAATTVHETHTFNADFNESPAVFAQVASRTGRDAVVSRIDNITSNSFRYLMQEEERSFLAPVNAVIPENGSALYGNFDALFPTIDDREFGVHPIEDFNYIALSDGDYGSFLVGSSDGVQRDTHEPFELDFSQAGFAVEGLLLQSTSTDAYNPATSRLQSITADSATVFFQEEASYDPEIQRRNGDAYSWLAFADGATLRG